jgi:hypothetical protein
MTARDSVLKMVTEWQEEIPGTEASARLSSMLENLRFLERVKFTPYIPTLYSRHPAEFSERFHRWLSNPGISSAQQRDLFEFAHCIAFFSFEDFTAMFQNAFSGPISRWCMSQADIRLDQLDWQARLNDERFRYTWFCPVTDSLLISLFHHVNGIEGKNRKPAFRELMHFGDTTADSEKNKIHRHIRAQGYRRIVLLEDFVGTGEQTFKTIEWAVRTLKLPVLFCPMIIAPEGADKYRKLKETFAKMRAQDPDLPDFDFAPVFELGGDCFVHSADVTPDTLFARIRALAEEIHNRRANAQQQSKEGALGYWNKNSPQKGTTVVMFCNTPNSSLPLLYRETAQWSPLFPRVDRQPL